MSILQAIVLGIIQGLTEFLPVSSSGHLAIAEYFFKQNELPILFDIVLHTATLLAVCTVFRKKILQLISTAFRFIIRKQKQEDRENLQTIASLLIAVTVTGIIGICIKDSIKNIDIKIISFCFIITGMLLILSEYFAGKLTNKKSKGILFQSIIIGIAQGAGVLPGISRSGSTISTGLFVGMNREKAGEFSFLLSIPTILAALLLELKDAASLTESIGIYAILAGVISAFISGYFSLKFLLHLIKKGKLVYFAFYLIPLGIFSIIYFSFFV